MEIQKLLESLSASLKEKKKGIILTDKQQSNSKWIELYVDLYLKSKKFSTEEKGQFLKKLCDELNELGLDKTLEKAKDEFSKEFKKQFENERKKFIADNAEKDFMQDLEVKKIIEENPKDFVNIEEAVYLKQDIFSDLRELINLFSTEKDQKLIKEICVNKITLGTYYKIQKMIMQKKKEQMMIDCKKAEQEIAKQSQAKNEKYIERISGLNNELKEIQQSLSNQNLSEYEFSDIITRFKQFESLRELPDSEEHFALVIDSINEKRSTVTDEAKIQVDLLYDNLVKEIRQVQNDIESLFEDLSQGIDLSDQIEKIQKSSVSINLKLEPLSDILEGFSRLKKEREEFKSVENDLKDSEKYKNWAISSELEDIAEEKEEEFSVDSSNTLEFDLASIKNLEDQVKKLSSKQEKIKEFALVKSRYEKIIEVFSELERKFLDSFFESKKVYHILSKALVNISESDIPDKIKQLKEKQEKITELASKKKELEKIFRNSNELLDPVKSQEKKEQLEEINSELLKLQSYPGYLEDKEGSNIQKAGSSVIEKIQELFLGNEVSVFELQRIVEEVKEKEIQQVNFYEKVKEPQLLDEKEDTNKKGEDIEDISTEADSDPDPDPDPDFEELTIQDKVNELQGNLSIIKEILEFFKENKQDLDKFSNFYKEVLKKHDLLDISSKEGERFLHNFGLLVEMGADNFVSDNWEKFNNLNDKYDNLRNKYDNLSEIKKLKELEDLQKNINDLNNNLSYLKEEFSGKFKPNLELADELKEKFRKARLAHVANGRNKFNELKELNNEILSGKHNSKTVKEKIDEFDKKIKSLRGFKVLSKKDQEIDRSIERLIEQFSNLKKYFDGTQKNLNVNIKNSKEKMEVCFKEVMEVLEEEVRKLKVNDNVENLLPIPSEKLKNNLTEIRTLRLNAKMLEEKAGKLEGEVGTSSEDNRSEKSKEAQNKWEEVSEKYGEAEALENEHKKFIEHNSKAIEHPEEQIAAVNELYTCLLEKTDEKEKFENMTSEEVDNLFFRAAQIILKLQQILDKGSKWEKEVKWRWLGLGGGTEFKFEKINKDTNEVSKGSWICPEGIARILNHVQGLSILKKPIIEVSVEHGVEKAKLCIENINLKQLRDIIQCFDLVATEKNTHSKISRSNDTAQFYKELKELELLRKSIKYEYQNGARKSPNSATETSSQSNTERSSGFSKSQRG